MLNFGDVFTSGAARMEEKTPAQRKKNGCHNDTDGKMSLFVKGTQTDPRGALSAPGSPQLQPSRSAATVPRAF
ncbi:MAG: hypothetical protein HZC54_02525 [Verrucomicrobia bacterium]|nr:hypothetical protein [Verrucomicrobiota bacterium]